MARDELIHVYRSELARRLPPEVLDELLDGLAETRDTLLTRGFDPDSANAAAIVEFGQPDVVVAAFTRNAPGRRYAVRLLATSPAFALLWGTALITTSVWNWPIPRLVEVAYGAALLGVASVLFSVLRAKNPVATGRAGYAVSGLIVLDLGMLAAVTFAAPTLSWTMVPAVTVSLFRIGMVAPRVPTLLAHARHASGGLG